MKSSIRTYIIVLTLSVFSIVSYFAFSAFNFESNSELSQQPKYSQVRIFATSENDINKMMNAGLIIDHAITKQGQFMDAWLSDYEMNQLNQSGVPYQVLIDDLVEYEKTLPRMTQAEIDAQMQQAYERDNITHSIYGTMRGMGYLKYTEVVNKLDSMRLEYPQFISQKFSIGQTIEGRTMWCVRVTK